MAVLAPREVQIHISLILNYLILPRAAMKNASKSPEKPRSATKQVIHKKKGRVPYFQLKGKQD